MFSRWVFDTLVGEGVNPEGGGGSAVSKTALNMVHLKLITYLLLLSCVLADQTLNMIRLIPPRSNSCEMRRFRRLNFGWIGRGVLCAELVWERARRAGPVSSLGKADHSDLRAIALATTSPPHHSHRRPVQPSDPTV